MAEWKETEVVTTTVTCPSCASEQVKKSGKRGGTQQYKCKICHKRFRHNGMSKGKRFEDHWVGMAIFNYFAGMSYRQIAKGMAYQYGIPKPSSRTIYNWVREYGHKAQEIASRTPVDGGEEWVADEMMVDVNGEKAWHFNIMSKDNKYLLASHLAKSNSTAEAMRVIQKALAVADKPPLRFRTDGNTAYNQAIVKLLPGTEHIVSEGAIYFINNNISERMQGSFRDRIRTLRGMNTIESGQDFLNGFVAHYNNFRDHQSVGGKPPVYAAKENPDFSSWTDVVSSKETVSKLPKRSRPDKSFKLGQELTRKQQSRLRYKRRMRNKGRKHRIRFGTRNGRQMPLVNKNGRPFRPRDKESLEHRRRTRERKQAGELKPATKPDPTERAGYQHELVSEKMLRERPPHIDSPLPKLPVFAKQKKVSQPTLEEQAKGQRNTARPQADLKAATVIITHRDGHQFSFEEYSKKHERIKAPEPVLPPVKMGKPKPPGTHLTDQIMRQMRPKTPGRKHR